MSDIDDTGSEPGSNKDTDPEAGPAAAVDDTVADGAGSDTAVDDAGPEPDANAATGEDPDSPPDPDAETEDTDSDPGVDREDPDRESDSGSDTEVEDSEPVPDADSDTDSDAEVEDSEPVPDADADADSGSETGDTDTAEIPRIGWLDRRRDLAAWLLTPLATLILAPLMACGLGMLLLTLGDLNKSPAICKAVLAVYGCEETTLGMLGEHLVFFSAAWLLLWLVPWWRGLWMPRVALALVAAAILIDVPIQMAR